MSDRMGQSWGCHKIDRLAARRAHGEAQRSPVVPHGSGDGANSWETQPRARVEVLKRRRRVGCLLVSYLPSSPRALIVRRYRVGSGGILTNIKNHTEAPRSAHIEQGRSSWSQTGHAVDVVVAFPHVAACARNARSRHSGEQYRWPHFSHVAHAKQVLAAATPTNAVVSPRDFRDWARPPHGRRSVF